MALRSLHHHLYGQRIDVGGHIVQIGSNGVITAPAHIEAQLLAQRDNWTVATAADMAAPPDYAVAAPVQPNIQKVLESQRLLASQPAVHTPSQMMQLTEDRIVRPGSPVPSAAPLAPVAPVVLETGSVVVPPLTSPLAPQPIEPTVQPQVLATPTAPSLPIQPPPTVAQGKPAIMRGRAGKRADAP